MGDLIGKIMAIVLAFMLLLIAPVVLYISVEDASARREVLNETAAFIDKIRDKGSVTQQDIDLLNAEVNSHGLVLDTEITRQVRAVITNADGENEVVYIAVTELDLLKSFSPGDLIQLHVYEPVTSFNRTFLRRVLGFAYRKLDLTFAGVVK